MKYLLPLFLVWSCFAEDLPGMRLRQDHECFVRKPGDGAYHQETVTAHGTCFAIGKRLLLTVAHNVIAGDNKVDAPKFEFGGKWNATKVLFMDEELDLALLETDTDVKPLTLAEKPAEPDDKVVMYGSFGGAEIDATPGKISRRYWMNKSFTLAALPFGHGNSGAPLLKDGKVVGIGDAGVPNNEGDIRKDMGLFIPVEVIKYFLDGYTKLQKAKKP